MKKRLVVKSRTRSEVAVEAALTEAHLQLELEPLTEDIKTACDAQSALLKEILTENESFLRARDVSAGRPRLVRFGNSKAGKAGQASR